MVDCQQQRHAGVDPQKRSCQTPRLPPVQHRDAEREQDDPPDDEDVERPDEPCDRRRLVQRGKPYAKRRRAGRRLAREADRGGHELPNRQDHARMGDHRKHLRIGHRSVSLAAKYHEDQRRERHASARGPPDQRRRHAVERPVPAQCLELRRIWRHRRPARRRGRSVPTDRPAPSCPTSVASSSA